MDTVLLEAFCEHMENLIQDDMRRRIESLVINNCGFGDYQVSKILQLLQHSKFLKQIQLAHDTIGDASADLLCKCIATGHKVAGLRKLSLNQVKF